MSEKRHQQKEASFLYIFGITTIQIYNLWNEASFLLIWLKETYVATGLKLCSCGNEVMFLRG
jgi:hypothetical protein